MVNVGKMISTIRRERGISQIELAELVGMSKQAISNYERGLREPDYVTLEAIADVLNVPVSMLISRERQRDALDAIYNTKSRNEESPKLPPNLYPISQLRRQRVPLIGRVAAGQPIMADTDYETFVTAPVDCDAALEVTGESMVPTYLPGDIIFIKHRPDVGDGQVAVVLIDDEATLKHVYKRPTGLTLISDNPEFAPIIVDSAEHDYIAIYGVPVGYTRIFKSPTKGKVKKGMR